METAARNLSLQEATEQLSGWVEEGLILLEPGTVPGKVNLDGWNPSTGEKENGNVAGVVIRYWPGGLKGNEGGILGGAAPDRLDPRNAVALIRLCQYLSNSWGISELYHAGISGDVAGGRTDCHGQGRAIDFVGVRGLQQENEIFFTVFSDWGHISVPGLTNANGDWLAGTGSNTSFRLLAAEAPDPAAAEFFQAFYGFAATQWQDRSDRPDASSAPDPSEIGSQSRFIMHPDHPTTAPSARNGREAHKDHIHLQIGLTGRE